MCEVCGSPAISRRAFVAGGLATGLAMTVAASADAAGLAQVEPAPGLKVFPRSTWGASTPPKGPLETEDDVRFLLVHHTATNTDHTQAEVPRLLRSFYGLHTSSAKGWNDIAYNFLIDREGGVWEGRAGSLAGPVRGDATGGNQGFDQLVCLIGDFTRVLPTAAALASLDRVLAWMADRYKVTTAPGATASFTSRGSNRFPAGSTVTVPTISGHRQLSLTACPGDALFPHVRDSLPQRVRALRTSSAPAPATKPTATTVRSTSTSTAPTIPVTTAVPTTTAAPPPTMQAAPPLTVALPITTDAPSRPIGPLLLGGVALATAGAAAAAIAARRRLAATRAPDNTDDPLDL